MTDVINLNLGDVINPATPGSTYGRCYMCKKGGLKVISRADLV